MWAKAKKVHVKEGPSHKLLLVERVNGYPFAIRERKIRAVAVSVSPKSLLFSPSQKDIKASSYLLFYPESSKIHCSQPFLFSSYSSFLLPLFQNLLSSLIFFLLLLFQNLLSFFLFFLRSMALTSRERAELPQPKQLNYRETSPERTKIWIEPMPKTNRKVAVVYYLSRNGLLEHPHFIEVPLSSPNGLHLKDFINRLNFLRGKSIAAMYSWSSKRSYKNGFVWQDLFESDFIYPTHGQEYVLKGSELLEPCQSLKDVSICSQKPMELPKLIDGVDFADGSRRAVDLNEYKVYKAELTAEISDASTQTDDQSLRPRRSEEDEDHKAELSGGEISPPPHSSSSRETLESVAKEENHAIDGEDARISDRTARNHPSGRIRASAVLKQLISCGSMSGREEHGVSMISRLAVAIPSGAQNQVVSRDAEELGDNYCFSGRLLDSKKKDDECGRRELADLRRRSSSFSLIRS